MGRVTLILISGLLAATLAAPQALAGEHTTDSTHSRAESSVESSIDWAPVFEKYGFKFDSAWKDVESAIAELESLVDVLSGALGYAVTGGVIEDLVDLLREVWTHMYGNLTGWTCSNAGVGCTDDEYLDMAGIRKDGGIVIERDPDEPKPESDDIVDGPGCGPFQNCGSDRGGDTGGSSGGGGYGGGGGVDGLSGVLDHIAWAISDLELLIADLGSLADDVNPRG